MDVTKRRGPKRGPGGRFLKHNAQRDESPSRPAGYSRNEEMGKAASTPSGTTGRMCEECGLVLQETRVRIHRHVLFISCCPRCSPNPVEILQAE